jgi:predicted O-methyltransferase YrrM
MFGYSSAARLHSMIRVHRSRRVIEVGGGYSSVISLDALRRNSSDTAFTCVEPHPRPWLEAAISNAGGKLVREPVQALPTELFETLEAGDLLFIDSSHVAKLGSDVNHLFHQVLPRLKSGVLVHVHDIYIPYEYPAEHFFSEHKIFWNEQYLLQAVLSSNPSYEILLPGFYVQTELKREFSAAFPRYDSARHRRTSSFYFRKLR